MTAGPECLPLERLAAVDLQADETAHVAACARCQTERALADAFDAAEPMAGEGAAVEWIVRETRRRVFPDDTIAHPVAPQQGGWLWRPGWMSWTGAALAASLGVYLLVRTPVPMPLPMESEPAYRSAAVAMSTPVGDVRDVPAELRWQPVAGAARYAVSVREVDDTEIWQTSSAAPMVALPDVVRSAAKPARTLRWRVEAFDASGARIGEAGTATFRVLPRRND